MNYKRTRRTKQAFNFIAPIVSTRVSSDPREFLGNRRTDTVLKIMECMLSADNAFEQIYCTQSYIARKSGCTRETANRVLLELESEGIIASNYRHKRSSLYKVSEYFRDLNVRKLLKDLIPCLYWLPLAMLMAREVRSMEICHTSNLYIYISQLNNKLAYSITGRIMSLAETRIRNAERETKLDRLRRGVVKKKVVQSLNVTPLGAAKLLAFSQQAREHGISELVQCKKLPDNIFATYVALCLSYSQMHQLIPDWTLAYREMRKLGYVSEIKKEWEYLDKAEPVFYKEIEVAASEKSYSSQKGEAKPRMAFGKEVVEPPKYQEFTGHTQPNPDLVERLKAEGRERDIRLGIKPRLITPQITDQAPPKEADEERLAKFKAARASSSPNPFLDTMITALEKRIAENI